jgi:hypothetical protein
VSKVSLGYFLRLHEKAARPDRAAASKANVLPAAPPVSGTWPFCAKADSQRAAPNTMPVTTIFFIGLILSTTCAQQSIISNSQLFNYLWIQANLTKSTKCKVGV